jgi:hypothetical protein
MTKLIAAYYHVRKIVNINKLSLSDQFILFGFHSITTKEQFSRVLRPMGNYIYIIKKMIRLKVGANRRALWTGIFKKSEILLDFFNNFHCK